VARADDIARGLLAHLRGVLGQPRLELDEAPAPLTGGFDTEIYTLRLREAPAGFTGPLVLRLLRRHHDPALVLREHAIQNAVAEQGYPAPRVVHASVDPAPIGAAFLLMTRLPGAPLIAARPIGMDGPLVDAQLRLHELDPVPLVRALGDAITFEGYLARFQRRLEQAELQGLQGVARWLRERRPPAADPPVICHGDLHPQNVLVEGGRVSGVVDWTNTVIADPAFDVASTRTILRFVPAELAPMPGPLRWLARVGQPILAARYVARYRRRRPIDAARLAYYEVAAILRALVRAGEVRRRTGHGSPPGPLDRSPYAARLADHAARVTGVAVVLPPMSDEP
jgi:aminoglycoside phosphotransferase (APT) family kinase protein